LKHLATLLACLFTVGFPVSILADADWVSLTIDNDLFVASDNGYTNGIYYSWADTPLSDKAEIGWLAQAMRWSLAERGPAAREYSVKTIGQSMVTPDDIKLEDPPLPPDDLPYAGLLFYNDIWIKAYSQRADRIGVTVGIVGEYSFAEESQKLVHDILNGDEPRGWDTQLNDEIVFQFSRAQVWRGWISANGNSDLLLSNEAALGTISSSFGVGAMYRYGRHMERSFATALLVTSRAANPVATDSGWYVFAGLSANYLANQIFLDGNTFDNDGQKSMDYDQATIGANLGVTYSWQDLAFTFALSDLSLHENDQEVSDYSRFGSFTLVWRNH
jgi:lipid A 3-O-deacylase